MFENIICYGIIYDAVFKMLISEMSCDHCVIGFVWMMLGVGAEHSGAAA